MQGEQHETDRHLGARLPGVGSARLWQRPAFGTIRNRYTQISLRDTTNGVFAGGPPSSVSTTSSSVRELVA